MSVGGVSPTPATPPDFGGSHTKEISSQLSSQITQLAQLLAKINDPSTEISLQDVKQVQSAILDINKLTGG